MLVWELYWVLWAAQGWWHAVTGYRGRIVSMRGGSLIAKGLKRGKRGLNAEDTKVTQRTRRRGVCGVARWRRGLLPGWALVDV
jgi:hypothetical protein